MREAIGVILMANPMFPISINPLEISPTSINDVHIESEDSAMFYENALKNHLSVLS